MNTLYYGDNLDILREKKYVQDESVDLIYLDPPFNSKRAYNVFFKDKTGKDEAAQIQAFEDTWSWKTHAQDAFDEITKGDYPAELKDVLIAFKRFLGINNLMAYLVMMAVRLVEMHRVLKITGSIYLHCDPTASHYLKILMDQIFGVENFRNEVIWKRTDAKGNVQKKYGWIHDRLLFYTKTKNWTWNQQYVEYDKEYLEQFYNKVDRNGRRYLSDNLTAPMSRAAKGQIYTWKGYTPPPSRCFVYNKQKMEELDRQGLIEYTSKGCPRFKRYLDTMIGNKCPDIWLDIKIAPKRERFIYPTQKPLALLERIIQASSNPGDVVMDPFCGCGTAVIAAEKLERSWIGIDVTHLAIALIKKRLRGRFPNAQFRVVGEPVSVDGARELAAQSKFQFESWAVDLLGGQKATSKGRGGTHVDGLLYFKDFNNKDYKVIIEVKGGSYELKDIRSLSSAMQEFEAPLGILIAMIPPTEGMLSLAASLGKWKMPGSNREYPVLQIVIIEDIFAKKYPDLPDTSGTFDRVKRELKETDKTKRIEM